MNEIPTNVREWVARYHAQFEADLRMALSQPQGSLRRFATGMVPPLTKGRSRKPPGFKTYGQIAKELGCTSSPKVPPASMSAKDIRKDFPPELLHLFRSAFGAKRLERILKLRATAPEKAPSDSDLIGEMLVSLSRPPSTKRRSKKKP